MVANTQQPVAQPAGPPRLHLFTCVETHRRNWGNDEIITNMFMGTTTKKSIHKGFALIWLDLTKAGLFTVTQEALGVTCLEPSLGTGSASQGTLFHPFAL